MKQIQNGKAITNSNLTIVYRTTTKLCCFLTCSFSKWYFVSTVCRTTATKQMFNKDFGAIVEESTYTVYDRTLTKMLSYKATPV